MSLQIERKLTFPISFNNFFFLEGGKSIEPPDRIFYMSIVSNYFALLSVIYNSPHCKIV